MLIFFILNMLLYSQNEINIKVNFENCVTCNLSKINYIFNYLDSNNSELKKTITIFHSDTFEPLLYKKKFNTDLFKIDTISKISNTQVELTINDISTSYNFNDFCIKCIKFSEIELKNRKKIEENEETILSEFNNALKIDSSYFLIVNEGKSIYKLENNKLQDYFSHDTNFVKSVLDDGKQYFYLTENYQTSFMLFNIFSIYEKEKNINMFFTSIDTISYDNIKDEFMVKYSYFTKSASKISKVNNRIINSYYKYSTLYKNSLIIQREYSYDNFKDEILISVENNDMKVFLTYKDLKLDSSKYISTFFRNNDNFYFYNIDDKELSTYNYLNKDENKYILENIPDNIYMFEHFIVNDYYIQLYKLVNGEVIINTYTNNEYELISTARLKNSEDIVDFGILEIFNDRVDFLIKRKKERWGVESLNIKEILK